MFSSFPLFVAGAAVAIAALPTCERQVVPPCSRTEPLRALPALPEASGVAASRRTAGLLWSINDSGEPLVIALDTAGATKASVRVTGARVHDWEDISVAGCPGGSCLYIADVGDNNRTRREIQIYRTMEPGVGDKATAPVETFTAAYPDGPHDAEAVFVIGEGRVFLVTKERAAATLYRFPYPLRSDGVMRLQRISRIGAAEAGGADRRPARVTDADVSPDGRLVALRSNERLLFFETKELIAGATAPLADITLTAIHEPQGEGATFGDSSTVYLVGEGGGGRRPGTFTRLRCSQGER